jgi:hypothetical protein
MQSDFFFFLGAKGMNEKEAAWASLTVLLLQGLHQKIFIQLYALDDKLRGLF